MVKIPVVCIFYIYQGLLFHNNLCGEVYSHNVIIKAGTRSYYLGCHIVVISGLLQRIGGVLDS